MITSTKNQQIKELQKIRKSSSHRTNEKLFVVEGTKMVEEALKYAKVKEIYVSESFALKETMDFPVTVEQLSDNVFKQVSDTVTPQGILAVVEMMEYSLEDLMKKDSLRLILLENLQDPGNMGTIIRTAEGAGMDGVLMGEGCVDIFSPKVVRSTMGSLFRMMCYREASFQELLKNLKAHQVSVVAADLKGTESYKNFHYPKRLAIVIGNESKGITEETKRNADYLVKIPMKGEVESLNASVAAALLMYESAKF